MRNVVALMVLAAAGFWPGVVNAQATAPGTPSSDFRTQMQAMRASAQTQAFAALTPDHRSKVQAIVAQFDSGAIATPRDAVQQIDAVLSPNESKAVTNIAVQMRANMMQMRNGQGDGAPNGAAQNGGPPNGGPPSGGPPNGGPPNGGPPNGGPPAGGAAGARTPDAGRFLLTVSADPAKLRAMRRPAGAPGQSQ